MKYILNKIYVFLCIPMYSYVFLCLTLTSFILVSSCKKDINEIEYSNSNSSQQESELVTKVVEFVESMNSIKSGGLESRTTYTLSELLDLAEEGMAYEYTTLSSVLGTTYSYTDTIAVSFSSSTAISQSEASVIYNAIASKASQQALRTGINPIYFFGLQATSFAETSTSANIIIFGTYINGDPSGTSGSPTIPEGRHYALNEKCTGGVANSAALELQNWVNSIQPAIGIGSNQYIQATFFTTAGGMSFPEYSSALNSDCLTLNPSDPIPGDGSIDTRSFYFLCPDTYCTGVDLNQVECISPSEYAYHAPQVNLIFNAEKARKGAQYLSNLRVNGYFGNVGSPNKKLLRWHLSGFALKIRSTEGPTPGKDITEPE